MATIVFRSRALTVPDVELRPSSAELAKPDFDAAWKRLCERVGHEGDPCEATHIGESPARALHRVWLPAVSRAAVGLDPFPPRPGTKPLEPEFVAAPPEPEFVAPSEPEFTAPLSEEIASLDEPEFVLSTGPSFVEPAPPPAPEPEPPAPEPSPEPMPSPPTAARLSSRGATAKPKTRRR